MIHEIFPVGPLQCNCSVIGDEQSREAMAIDPGDEIDRVLQILEHHKLKLKMIVVTHGHIDHIGGAGKLHRATGAPIMMNEYDQTQIKMLPLQAAWIGMALPGKVAIDHAIAAGEKLVIGSLKGAVMHTPGHTEGSICIYFPAEKKLIAGDTLFAGSIGRTDLPGGDTKKILHSLRGQLMALPDETIVVPGHGPLTSIGVERVSNPFLVG